VFEIPLIGSTNAIGQGDACAPAEGLDAVDVQEFSRGAVGFGRIERQAAGVADDFADQLGQFANADVFACADIEEFRRVVLLEQEAAGAGEIVYVEEFAAGLAVPQTATSGAPLSLASWTLRMSAGMTWEVSRSKLSPGRRDSSAWPR